MNQRRKPMAARVFCLPLRRPETAAFTLIEMSIVLVIIGLVVGGILVGQNLIAAAGVRATISQIEKYQTAVNTFRGKYGCLPGDCANAAIFGFSARGAFAGEGDGNGVIEGVSSNAAAKNLGTQETAGETATFWVDLSAANLIEGGLNTASETAVSPALTPSSVPSLDAYLPQAKLGQGNYIYVYSYQNVNYFGLSAVATIATWGMGSSLGGGLALRDAYAIDLKTDDGMPLTGAVTATFVGCCDGSYALPGSSNSVQYGGQGGRGPASYGTFGWSASFFDNNGIAGVQPKYSLAQNGGNGLNCGLSFRFQ